MPPIRHRHGREEARRPRRDDGLGRREDQTATGVLVEAGIPLNSPSGARRRLTLQRHSSNTSARTTPAVATSMAIAAAKATLPTVHQPYASSSMLRSVVPRNMVCTWAASFVSVGLACALAERSA